MYLYRKIIMIMTMNNKWLQK